MYFKAITMKHRYPLEAVLTKLMCIFRQALCTASENLK